MIVDAEFDAISYIDDEFSAVKDGNSKSVKPEDLKELNGFPDLTNNKMTLKGDYADYSITIDPKYIENIDEDTNSIIVSRGQWGTDTDVFNVIFSINDEYLSKMLRSIDEYKEYYTNESLEENPDMNTEFVFFDYSDGDEYETYICITKSSLKSTGEGLNGVGRLVTVNKNNPDDYASATITVTDGLYDEQDIRDMLGSVTVSPKK